MSSDHAKTLLDWPAKAGRTAEVLAGLEARARVRSARRRLIGFCAGATAAGLLLLVGGRYGRVSGSPAIASTLNVLAPEVRILADGSRVELARGARVSEEFTPTERRVRLVAGTAHFAVVKNPARPFIVSAGGVSVRAVGTAFSVDFAQRGVTVLVTEGRVSVASAQSASRPLATVSAGSGVMVPATAEPVRTLAPSEFGDQLRWRVPRLEFSGMPLGDVVRAMNRYNPTQLRIEDPSLNRLRVSGTISADKVMALLGLVGSDFQVSVVRIDDHTLLLRSR